MPMWTEIAPLLIMTKLEQFDYAGATAIALRDAGGLVRAAVRDQSAAAMEPEAAWWLTRRHERGHARAPAQRPDAHRLADREPALVHWLL